MSLLAAVGVALLSNSATAAGIGYRFVVVGADGTKRSTLIRNMQVTVLDLSPDRRRLVYERPTPGGGLYVSNLNGKTARLILRTGSVQAAYWSPNGRWIALYAVGSVTGQPTQCGSSVWTIRPDGSELRLVSDCAELGWYSSSSEQPWSPDSRQLVFAGDFHFTANGTLTVADLDGTNRRAFFSINGLHDASWSPDGEWIAYGVSAQNASSLDLLRVSDGMRVDLGRGFSPTWAPRGRRLAFVDAARPYAPGKRRPLAIVSPSGGNLKRNQLNSTFAAALPTWSPDGKRIAYSDCARRPTCRQPQIYSVTWNGRARRQVSNEHDIATVNFDHLWWSADGKHIFFGRWRSGAGD